MEIDLCEAVGIAGKKNSGKSVLIEYLLCQMERFICLDPKNEHGPPDCVFASSVKEALRLWYVEGETKIVIRDAPLTTDKMIEYVRLFGQLTGCWLVIDEAHNYMGSTHIPDPLKDVVKWHITHNNCGVVVGVHQIKEIHDRLFSQIDHWFMFAYGDHEDSKFSKLSIPGKRKVHDLDPDAYRFLYYEDVAGAESQICGPVPVPSHLS